MDYTSLKYITGKNEGTDSKCRVFCTFHPENKTIANNVMQDIISVCDCNVFYYEDGVGPSADDLLEADLGGMALFVFIISSNYLHGTSFAKDVAHGFAVKHMIPILPIMIENGLEEPFNSSMGNLQYILLNTEHYDSTSVPYIEKLSNHLQRMVTSNKDVQRLRSAFDTSIFLSYRKKDRRFAQELMNLIHNDEACRSIAIWYDEFLVPGENFNEGIRSEMESSTACILVITPHIVEKNNYITLTEYPMAVSMGKTIIPFEMVPTDRDGLAEAYPGLSEPFSGVDAKMVHSAIHRLVEQIGAKPMESCDEKEYLMGLAYLKGVYVERNIDIGVGKIIGAAERGLEEAIETVVSMYRNGEGVTLSLENAELWQKKVLDIRERVYSESKNDDDAQLLIEAYFELCRIYEQGAESEKAVKTYDKIIELCLYESLKGKGFVKELRVTALEMAAGHLIKMGKYASARYQYLDSALDIRKEQEQSSNVWYSCLNLIETRAMIADCCEKCQDIPGLKTETILMKNCIPDFSEIEDIKSYEYDTLKRFLICNNKLGHFYAVIDKWHEGFLCSGNSVLLAEKLREISDTYDSHRQLVLALINQGDQHAYKKVENHLRAAEQAYARASMEAIMIIANNETTTEIKLDHARIMRKQANVKKDLGLIVESFAIFSGAIDSFKELCDIIDTIPIKKELYDCMREASCVYEKLNYTTTCESLLKESIALAYEVIEVDELAVYKKDCAASLDLLADFYKKQWDADEAFRCRKEQCELLRAVMNGTGRVGDMKALFYALNDAVSAARFAGEFEEGKVLAEELCRLYNEYEVYLKN